MIGGLWRDREKRRKSGNLHITAVRTWLVGKKKVERFSNSHETKWDCKYKDINRRDAVWETRYLLSCLASLLSFFCCCHDSAKLDWYLGTSCRWYSNWNLSGVSSENKNKQEQQQNSAYLIFIHRSQFFPKLVFCTFARISPCCKLCIFFPSLFEGQTNKHLSKPALTWQKRFTQMKAA